ncbi:MAG: xanthine phosphoribosyltransferase [Oscillospiraceae bacterium]|nr:xanthine phosphoribosyltransferase [Oscillospiraceae bacterium]
MRLLEERIAHEALAPAPDVLRVDMFLNHLIDTALLDAMGREFYRLFEAQRGRVTKILTVEASGIAIACAAAARFDVPVLFAKKGASNKTLDRETWSAAVRSFTKDSLTNISVAKRFLGPEDSVLVIDDFLAHGAALRGLREIIAQAGAQLLGVGVAIEKGFQPGGRLLRAEGIHLESLAIVDSLDPLIFREQN